MKKTALVIIYIMFFVSLGYCEIDNDGSVVVEYEIILKDGKSINTKMCWEDGDKLVYQKYGSTIGLSKSKIKEVKEIKSYPDVDTVQYNGGRNKEENSGGNRNYDCTEKHCPKKGRCFGKSLPSRSTVNKMTSSTKRRIALLEKRYDKLCNIHKEGDPTFDSIVAVIEKGERGLECLFQVEFEKGGKGYYVSKGKKPQKVLCVKEYDIQIWIKS